MLNIKNTVDAHKYMITQKADNLFKKYKVLSREELHSRFEIYIEQYSKQISIEAKTAIKMVKRQYLPEVIRYIDLLSGTIAKTKECEIASDSLLNLLAKITTLFDSSSIKLNELETKLNNTMSINKLMIYIERAETFRNKVFYKLNDLRKDIDELETLIPSDIWPTSTYSDMLYKL